MMMNGDEGRPAARPLPPRHHHRDDMPPPSPPPPRHHHRDDMPPPSPPPPRHHHRDDMPPPSPPPPRHHHRDYMPSPSPPPPPAPAKKFNWLSVILRSLALILALTSAIVMASSACTLSGSSTSGVVSFTFTYTRFSAFVLLIAFNITATILEAAAIYLQFRLGFAAAAEDKTAIEIALVLLDHVVPALLYSAMAAAYAAAALCRDEIASCPLFAAQVERAKIISLFACFAIMFSGVTAKGVPLPFNLPSFLA